MPRKQKQEESQSENRRRKGRQTTPVTPFDETQSAGEPAGDAETDVRLEETSGTPAEVEQTASETDTTEPAGDVETDVRPEETAGAPVEVEQMTNETTTTEPAAGVETDVRLEDTAGTPAEVERTPGETLTTEPTAVVETEVRLEDTARTPAEVEQTPTDTHTDVATGQPVAATAEQPPAGDAKPELDTPTALALRRWREHPTCCCGCGEPLSSTKKNFAQGHDGRAKKIIRRIMRGELPAGEAPVELILRHAEIKFVMGSPEFGRVVEAWREICGLTHIVAGK